MMSRAQVIDLLEWEGSYLQDRIKIHKVNGEKIS